mgnify:CR=1
MLTEYLNMSYTLIQRWKINISLIKSGGGNRPYDAQQPVRDLTYKGANSYKLIYQFER